jgi:hypothetical protein
MTARHRTSSDVIAEKKLSLLAIIEGAARNGHVCPGLTQLSLLLHLNPKTIHAMFHSLRNDGVISWSIVFGFGATGQKVRVVTIKATGARTAMPGRKKHVDRESTFKPTAEGCGVRDLRKDNPAAFQAWKLHYESIDRAERAKEQACLSA